MPIMEDAPTSADLDRIADTLRRIRTGGSSRSSRRNVPSLELEREFQSSPDSMTTARRYRGTPREYQTPSSSANGETVAQWLEENEDAISINSQPSQRDSRSSLHSFRERERPSSGQRESMASHRKFSNASSHYSGYSLYPAPSKPLPPLPNSPARPSMRVPSRESSDRSSLSTNRSSQASAITSGPDAPSVSQSPPPPRKTQFFHRPLDLPPARNHLKPAARTAEVVFWKLMQSEDKKVTSVFYLDMSSSLSTLASKHGNNIIKIWSTAGGTVQHVIKFSSYTSAQSRSREYLIRSHAIVSEPSNLIAIATRFGRSIEVWNWAKKKCLQTIDNADRWTSAQVESYDGPLSSFAIYHCDNSAIDLYTATREKKPFTKMRTIDMTKADLPFVPQYPELALSTTSPLVVVAAGPRPPRQGHPPPERETLLVAWETPDNGVPSNKPYRVARPWQHTELDTAIPCDLVTYGSAVVSIWIPATFRAVPAVNGSGGYNLAHVPVPYRYVLVWDLAANSTRTFGIPNTTSCVSPDCRFVAYCHSSGTEIGARGCLVILDVMTGKDVWSWPDPEALAIDSGPKQGFEQFDDLSRVTELHFSADGKFLNVGDIDGNIGMYEVREQSGDRIQLHAI
ncbi:hypothetical protein PT974_03239 [Cladobotryum mycophilum]|uniref:Uncharacterized protein n=1 Tax=Cladobotryum mycophilum TaxID=491253 RepID=A0ABR0SRU5_9HYPO